MIRLLTLLALASIAGGAHAQSRPAFFDEPSELRAIGSGDQRPIVVFLPATGGTSADMLAHAAPVMPFDAYVAVLPPGRPSSSDYLPNFGAFVGWMDARLTADLATARALPGVDATRIYLVGFSLGGDTSYALLLRHPDVYAGAVVLGSRSSAQARGSTMQTLVARQARVAFAIGEDDDATRVTGMQRAYEAMQRGHVPAVMRRYPGSHQAPDGALLGELLRFALVP